MVDVTPELDAFLALLQATSSSGQFDLEAFTAAAVRLDDASIRASVTADVLDTQEQARLGRQLGQVGIQLCALDRCVRGTAAGVSKTSDLLTVAFETLYSCGSLAIAAHLDGQHAEQLLSAVTLLLGSGTRELEELLRRRAPADCTQACKLAGPQLLAAYMLLDLAEDNGALVDPATALLNPDATIAWLNAVTQTLQWAGQAGGEADIQFLEAHSAVCNRLFVPQYPAAYQELRAAVTVDGGLQSLLLAQILDSNLLEAVSALLPEEEGGQGKEADETGLEKEEEPAGNRWRHISHASLAALSVSLRSALTARLQQAQAHATLQHALITLARELPVQPPPGVKDVTFAVAWSSILQMLRCAFLALEVQQRQRQRNRLTAALRAASWQLVEVLPRLTAAIRASEALARESQPGLDTVEYRLSACQTMAAVIEGLTRVLGCGHSSANARSMLEVAKLLRAGEAAVGLLPMAQEVWQLRRDSELGLPNSDVRMADACLQLWTWAFTRIPGVNGGAMPEGSPEEQEAACRAARRYQLAACRVVHWAQAAADPAFLGALKEQWSNLKMMYNGSILATTATTAVMYAEEQRTAGDVVQTAAFKLQEGADYAARWEALHAVLLHVGPTQLAAADPDAIYSWATQLVSFAKQAPRAVVVEQRTQPALHVAALMLQQRRREDSLTAVLMAAGLLEGAPLHCWTALVDAGVLAAALDLPNLRMAKQDFVARSSSEGQLTRFIALVLASFSEAAEGIATLAAAESATSSCADDTNGAGSSSTGSGGGSSIRQQLRLAGEQLGRATEFEVVLQAAKSRRDPAGLLRVCAGVKQRGLPAAEAAARLLMQLWREPEQAAAGQLELAQAAATRSCAYLRCANLEAGSTGKRCSYCRTARYCSTTCSHADWRAGHRRVCKALAAATQEARQGRP